jgi:hypothetical protein
LTPPFELEPPPGGSFFGLRASPALARALTGRKGLSGILPGEGLVTIVIGSSPSF